MARVRFTITTSEKYNALEEYDQYTLYWLKDVQGLYKGNVCYGYGAVATTSTMGLLPAADKALLEELRTSGLLTLRAADGSIDFDIDQAGNVTLAVQISNENGNVLRVEEDGLFVPTGAISIDNIGRGLDLDVSTGVMSLKLDTNASNGLTLSDDGLSLALATAATAGALSAADKQKLDEFENLVWEEF